MSDAKVIFDYDAEADDELTLKEGDVIRDIEKKEDGWWEGELHGRRGMFPENFVQEIKKSAPDLRQEKAEKPFASKEKTTVAKVTFDYKAENDDELTLNEGDMVKVLSLVEEGWWKGELNGKVGVFPANFVEVVKGPIPPATDVGPVGAEPSLKEPAEKADSPEKKAKIVGGMGFGGLLTKDALSGIKLRKSTSNTNANPNHKAGKSEEPSELSKRMSMKRHPPKVPEPEKAPKSTSKPKERVLVEFDYDGEQSDELTLHKGEIVYVIEKDVSEGWSKGELNGNIGLFPDNFVTPLPPVDPQKDADMNRDRDKSSELPNKKPLMGEDLVDAKQSRPEFPFPSLKKTAERPPPPKQPSDSSHSEFPVNLKPVPKPPEETSKQQETSMSESKQEEKPPKFQVKPAKRSPPLLPKKPDKPDKPEKPEKPDKPDKPKIPPDLPLAKGPQQSPPSSRKPPPAVLRHLNGPDKDPSKRLSAITPGEVSHHEAKFKRHSQGAEISVDLNDIKPSAVLQPLTADRPKNTARKPPTKYDKPLSPKKINTPEKTNDAEWPKVKEEKEEKKPAIEKPKKPAAPESSRSKISSGPTLDTSVMKNMQDEINTLKQSLTSITKEFKEHVRATENRFKKMEKKLLDEVEDLTKELDEEKKARSAVDVEVNRLRKLIRNQTTS